MSYDEHTNRILKEFPDIRFIEIDRVYHPAFGESNYKGSLLLLPEENNYINQLFSKLYKKGYTEIICKISLKKRKPNEQLNYTFERP